MALEDTLEEWKAKEAASDPTTAKWYLVAVSWSSLCGNGHAAKMI